MIYVAKDLVGRAVAYFKVLSNQQTEDTQETEVIRRDYKCEWLHTKDVKK